MRNLVLAIFVFFCTSIKAQFKVNPIHLSSEVEYYDNQYSSLYISDQNLYLMSECRIEDKRPAYLDRISLRDLDSCILDSSLISTAERLPILGLEYISEQLKKRHQLYEGLEAMVIDRNNIYFSIETNTPSDSCYIIKGKLSDQTVILDSIHFVGIAKPKDASGKNVYNAGFESLEIKGNKLIAVFEYNYFKDKNNVVLIDKNLNEKKVQYIPIPKIPYRITDISNADPKKRNMDLYAINFFFKGGGDDAVYRVDSSDAHFKEINTNGEWHNFSQIIRIFQDKNKLVVHPIGVLPNEYWGYNWEGLAKYKNGFFILNDKYTPSRPYKSTLLFIKNTASKVY